jgi:excisionase family DNA binding protein
MNRPKLLSVKEVADLMGISRMTVVRKIKKGEIQAKKVGRSYVISQAQLPSIYRPLSNSEKKEIDHAVQKVIDEYGEVLKRLGKE